MKGGSDVPSFDARRLHHLTTRRTGQRAIRRMVVGKMDRMRQTALAVVAVLVLVASCAAQAPDPTPAYVERGHRTEARQKAFREGMERFYQALSRALRGNAPDLLRDIAPPPPGAGSSLGRAS